MLKQITFGIVLLAGLLVGTAWADEALDKALFDAADKVDTTTVANLIEKGADVHAKTAAGWTPLHIAARKGNYEVAKLLISKGVDVNAKADDGWTPLHWVAFNGNKELAELLIAKGADVNAKNEYGSTPLHIAAHWGNKEVAELLIVNGANVNAKEVDDMTPLYSAAMFGKKQVAELLISNGADMNAKDSHGKTPLDSAIEAMSLEMEKKNEIVAFLQAEMQKRGEMATLLQTALQNQSGNQREIFNRVMAAYQGRAMSDTIRRPFIALAAKLRPAPAVPEEAIKYEGRAQFAFKNAESPADVLSAAREYEKAVAIAPWVPGYYADLCTIYEKAKDYANAKRNCEFFLASSPPAQEANDVRKRIAGLEFAMEKANSPEAQAARQVVTQQEKDAALNRSLDGAVFVKRAAFDYGTAEWEIRINSGEATYSYDVIAWATSDPPCEKIGMRRPCGTWRQILMNSWYSGSRMDLASGQLAGRQFTLVRAFSSPGLEAGSMPCEVSSDGTSITCTGDLIDGKTFIFQRR